MDPQECFDGLVTTLRDRPGVELPDPTRRTFGARTLRVHGSIFAMVQDEALVVKLPEARVAELLAEGTGRPFGNRPMKEWVSVPEVAPRIWLALAEEALAFVGRA
ncbi:TfoX/Sxy family protein [Actinomycetospora termitidis]|uniref:TfoX/Sxy family protein n=1 Tax=Actinomycetospora termitidis TaxID=3053470 RepID=A0ABT7M1E6_9PSEU|nr:TfoX/Sxy family protein [Actinomycetospora sp. Odt1-22]MDL5154479.1 TfoX/Sxy family protein [Actinomycetospora sp. Odt1-22]